MSTETSNDLKLGRLARVLVSATYGVCLEVTQSDGTIILVPLSAEMQADLPDALNAARMAQAQYNKVVSTASMH